MINGASKNLLGLELVSIRWIGCQERLNQEFSESASYYRTGEYWNSVDLSGKV
jgi:hypothetical protein